MPGILRRLARIGIAIEPFLIAHEDPEASGLSTNAMHFQYGFIGPEQVEKLIQSRLISSREDALRHFQEGSKCFVAWDGDRIAAKMWCDFENLNNKRCRRPLTDDEIYLYGAFSHPDYRGQGLAPATRQRCYQALRELGKTRLFSITDYYNLSARRFKEKLGARDETLHLHICLFGRWSRTFTLRRYPTG